MQVQKIMLSAVCWLSLTSSPSMAETVTSEPDHGSYHFVSHYEIEINAPAEQVWKHLTNLSSWMYRFEMSHHSGKPGEVGEVIRLYPEQDFFVQITELIPNKLLVFANLPTTFKGEYSTGNSVNTLNEFDGRTIVTLTMTRRYTWRGEGDNPLRKTRESKEFQNNTRATWHAFLTRLKELVEAEPSSPEKSETK